MGAWSHEPFGNDTANDWADGLAGCTDASYIEATLDRVLNVGEQYLDASEAEEAVAAIEVLAKVLGRGTQTDSYTRKVDAWVNANKPALTPVIRMKAKQAIQRIVSNSSELRELWEESDEGTEWKTAMNNLRAAIDA